MDIDIKSVIVKLLKNALYIVSAIVDIVAIIGLYNEMIKDVPNSTKLVLYIVVIVLAIMAAVAYSIVVSNLQRIKTLENIGDIFKLIHRDLIHKVRDRIGELKGESCFSKSMNKELLQTCDEILETLVDLQSRLNGKKKIYACIKLILSGPTIINDATKKDAFITTYARSKNTDRRRKRNRDKIPILGNTDFESIIDGENYFSSGDLPNLFSKGEYKNTTKDFGKYYKSTVCVPIRLSKNIFIDDGFENDEIYEIFGFLCIDTKDLMPEWEKDDHFAFHITAIFADALYILLKEYMSLPNEDVKVESKEKSESYGTV